MKKLFRIPTTYFYTMFVAILFTGCQFSTTPKDLEPIVNGQFKNAKKIFYPSTDFKVSAIVIDENGDVYYLRMNGSGDLKDEKVLFNVSEYCH